ncbi:hypothetical protein Tco_0568824 [Tanacetum coccineum]
MPHDSPLPRGHTLGSDEGRMQQHELMDLVTKLSDRCEALETDLRQPKKVYSDAFTRLTKKVKKLEQIVNTSQARRRSRVVIFDDVEEDLEVTAKESVYYCGASMPVSTASLVQEASTPSSVATKDKAYGKSHSAAIKETFLDELKVCLRQNDKELELDHEGSKKQKTNEALGSVQEQPEEEEETKLSQDNLQQMMMVVPVEEVYVEALQVKYPIIDWEIYSKDTRRYWRIIRVGNHTEAYQSFDDMLKKFDRDDLDKL